MKFHFLTCSAVLFTTPAREMDGHIQCTVWPISQGPFASVQCNYGQTTFFVKGLSPSQTLQSHGCETVIVGV